MENRKVKQVLLGGYKWKGEEYKERAKEAECCENIYLCMKMEKGDLLKLF
jgi:hypothetical protein